MSIPIHIPESLSSNKEWAEWIEQLPDIVTACAKHWDLRIEAPLTEDYAEMSYSYIAPATRSDGTEVILKIGSPLQRLENEKQECHALQLCDGNSTVKLLDFHEEPVHSCSNVPDPVSLWGYILMTKRIRGLLLA